MQELVPLMLADATRHVAWKPRHRESVLRVLAEANHPQLATQLFERWSTSQGGAYACGGREAALLMAAFATTGDWRCADALRVRLPTVSGDVLVDYVRAFITALKSSGGVPAGASAGGAGLPQTSAKSQSELVPWEVAMDVAAKHKESPSLAAAAAQLQHVAHQSAAPTDVSRWWWAAETTVHTKLTELRRRALRSTDEVTQLLTQSHVTKAGVVELLRAIEESGVLSANGDLSHYWTQWLEVVLALSWYCPSALVSSNGFADGLARLLPRPHLKVVHPSSVTSSFTPLNASREKDLPLWQYVVARMLAETASDGQNSGVARCVLTFTATLHYLLFAQERAASSTTLSNSAAQDISETVGHACARWTAQLRALQRRRHADADLDGQSPSAVASTDAIVVHLNTLGAFTHLPTFEQCVSGVLCDATAMAGAVDTSILAFMKPLEQLGEASALCEVVCAALSNVSSPPPHAAYVLTLYTCHELQKGTAVVTLRPLLRRVELVLLDTASNADALVLLCAQLQWCWGGSLESLRVLAVPILTRRRCWHALACLLARCPPPLSTQEQRAAATCAEEQQLEELELLVRAGDVVRAWERWGEVYSDDAAELSLSVPLHTALVSLLLSKGRIEEACEVLAVAPVAGAGAASEASWPHLGLRVCRHVLRNPQLELTLSNLWEVAQMEGSAVTKREATMGLAMFAAMALSLVGRAADAFRVLDIAEEHVVQYDETHHHHHQQHNLPSREDKRVAEKSDWRSSSLVLHKTDAQMSESIPLYVQCAMPPILLSALSSATTVNAELESHQAASAVLRVARHVFLLTSHAAEAMEAWSAVLPRLYTTALKHAEEKSNRVGAGAADGDAASHVLSMACLLLSESVGRQVAVSHAVLQLSVTAITAKAFSPDCTTALTESVRRALCAPLAGSDGSSDSSISMVQANASQVARSLAAQGSYAQALEWVDEFNLWTATADSACIPAATLWMWIQAGCSDAQRQTDTRASLQHQRRSDEAAKNAKGKESHAALSSSRSLDALLECGAWQDAVSCYMHVVLEPRANQLSPTTDPAHTPDAAMELAELRDSYLTPRVLNRVMQTLAHNAPWRTCIQAWMLLCVHLPLFSWNASASEVMPALQLLLSAMQQQGAQSHDVGMVLVWIAAQFDPPLSAISPLLQQFACAVAAAPVWTRAEGELCAARLHQLRHLLGEQRVREATQAIAEAEVALAWPMLRLPQQQRQQPLPCVWNEGGGGVGSEMWLQPGRPLLSSSEVDALAVLAPLLVLATTPQLEVLARRHLGGRFQGFELKALLWWYRDELRQRVKAAQELAGDDALVRYLAHNVTLHVHASQAFAQGVDKSETAAAKWLAEVVFDDLVPLPLAARVWAACRTPAAALAACRWTPLVEAELCEALLRHHGKPPAQLRTAPHISRQAIAHYWSCFHIVLVPELHFGPLELCCLAAYVPALMQLRTQHPDSIQPGYRSAMRELAGQVHRTHFSPSRVPAEDTLAYLRRPHSAAAIAAVMTTAYKKLKVLHSQLFTSADATAASDVARTLPGHLHQHFATCGAAVSFPDETPARLQQADLAAAARRLSALYEHKPSAHPSSASYSLCHCPPVFSTVHDHRGSAEAPLSISELLGSAQKRLPSLLTRSWVSWVMAACVVPRQPIPPAVSLLLVEWVKSALHSPQTQEYHNTDVISIHTAQMQWSAQAAAGQRELQQRRCRELSCVWQLLTDTDAWLLMNFGHRAALEKMVRPSTAQVRALPTKTRGGGGGQERKKTEQRPLNDHCESK
ncbi:hypothetical protein ABB37_10073 [Leptomonas pyrrhocoris]|uniref:Uncharacterized protein n=1 Tax=Leptomonas pyrrhocoris TaxID=157538 RepID=A0A0N0DQL1_LEPPY|nr:hypothetical protein ABB37_10073 [Leptomonas pyrrhocoris]KPA73172.1 hypothetical protein ABB37_10073 [Leptomonas pyrrhocoris]|eukprot:XP_015651611.1 hypothetical protein ABB37_10073 [Leptomonas pyrrhocoris]